MKGYTSSLPLFDLKSPAPSVQPVDPHVLPSDVPRLSRNNLAVLARLRQGPATTIELMGPELGGIRPSARVFDLIAAGAKIKSERVKNGVALYTLTEYPKELS